MGRFVDAIGRFFKRFRLYDPTSGLDTPPESGVEEPPEEFDPNLSGTGEPQEELPDAELNEKERLQAVRRHKRQLREGQR